MLSYFNYNLLLLSSALRVSEPFMDSLNTRLPNVERHVKDNSCIFLYGGLEWLRKDYGTL